MNEYNIGRVAPVWRGNYNPNTEYTPLDVVYYGGSSYLCTENCIGVTPSEDAPCWGLLARSGHTEYLTPEQLQQLKQDVYNYLVNNGAVFELDYTHTDNNYSDEDKAKMNDIEAGAQVNVQSDWSITDESDDRYIANKPNIITDDTSRGYIHTDNNYTDTEKTKLAGIDTGAQVNVQPNWNETNGDSDAFIKNKPVLHQVATSGNYSDLTNKPALFSGSYNDLTNKPTIPSRISQLTNDAVFVVPPTTNNHGAQANVSIATLNGNEKHIMSNLRSLTVSAFGDNTSLPSWLYFETTPDVSLNLTMPNDTLWICETPLFYAEEYARKYCIRIEDKIAQLFVLANATSTYPDDRVPVYQHQTWKDWVEEWDDLYNDEPLF